MEITDMLIGGPKAYTNHEEVVVAKQRKTFEATKENHARLRKKIAARAEGRKKILDDLEAAISGEKSKAKKKAMKARYERLVAKSESVAKSEQENPKELMAEDAELVPVPNPFFPPSTWEAWNALSKDKRDKTSRRAFFESTLK